MVLIKVEALFKFYNYYLYHFFDFISEKTDFWSIFRMLLNLLGPDAKKRINSSIKSAGTDQSNLTNLSDQTRNYDH